MSANKPKHILMITTAFFLSITLGILIDNMFIKKQMRNIIHTENDTESLFDIKKVYRGDTKAYDKLKHYYLDYPQEDMLYWSFLMANTYHDGVAYRDAATLLESICDNDPHVFFIKKADTLTEQLILK